MTTTNSFDCPRIGSVSHMPTSTREARPRATSTPGRSRTALERERRAVRGRTWPAACRLCWLTLGRSGATRPRIGPAAVGGRRHGDVVVHGHARRRSGRSRSRGAGLETARGRLPQSHGMSEARSDRRRIADWRERVRTLRPGQSLAGGGEPLLRLTQPVGIRSAGTASQQPEPRSEKQLSPTQSGHSRSLPSNPGRVHASRRRRHDARKSAVGFPSIGAAGRRLGGVPGSKRRPVIKRDPR